MVEYFCKFCNRSFSRRQSKWKHETNRCAFKLNSDSEVIENEIREKLLEELAESGQLVKTDQQLIKSGNINIDKSQNNSGTINNITISLNSYDNTDKSYIKNTDILTCIKKGNMGIPHMIHLLHCNKYKPENHNVSLNNIKSSYIGVYNGRKWDYEMQFELNSRERYMQICPANITYPMVITEVDSLEELGNTTRGSGGFGSTGN